VADAFNAADIPAAPYLSKTDPATRQALISKLLDGNIRIFCVVDILNEGADLPFVECLLFLRPTEPREFFFSN
jgi:superfamily II DNA or RNA helicase